MLWLKFFHGQKAGGGRAGGRTTASCSTSSRRREAEGSRVTSCWQSWAPTCRASGTAWLKASSTPRQLTPWACALFRARRLGGKTPNYALAHGPQAETLRCSFSSLCCFGSWMNRLHFSNTSQNTSTASFKRNFQNGAKSMPNKDSASKYKLHTTTAGEETWLLSIQRKKVWF